MKFDREQEMLIPIQLWLRQYANRIDVEFGCGFQNQFIPDVVGIAVDMIKVQDIKRTTPRSRGQIRKLIGQGELFEKYDYDLIAIELKLRNFVEAYFQAKMYAWFGFRSYIAMPEGVYNNLPHIRKEVLRNEGLGFLEVGEKGVVDVRLEAKHRVRYSIEDKVQIVERLIMRLKKELTQ